MLRSLQRKILATRSSGVALCSEISAALQQRLDVISHLDQSAYTVAVAGATTSPGTDTSSAFPRPAQHAASFWKAQSGLHSELSFSENRSLISETFCSTTSTFAILGRAKRDGTAPNVSILGLIRSTQQCTPSLPHAHTLGSPSRTFLSWATYANIGPHGGASEGRERRVISPHQTLKTDWGLGGIRAMSASKKPKRTKMKAYSSFKERFKLLATGDFKRWKAGKRHNAKSKTRKQKRQLRQPTVVSPGLARVMRKYAFGS
eukprot:TRINITY_DN3676_c0_g2_i1.p1 TRINITY_DN3676_c0_g2~~TRINITY_DN3676_c0_g2_i1.p1  ORF type:complete len:261 (-),score=35.08 TRINITY_DN3676_c0_g2_i1:14-796(-)